MFPIGLELTFHVSDDSAGQWNEQFRVLQWASEFHGDVLEIHHSSTLDNESTLLFVDISTWTLILSNGSTTEFPVLWANVSDWSYRETINLPHSTDQFHLSLELTSILMGTFFSWHARSVVWFSVDDDYQLSSENWYFHHTQGVLLKQSSEILASQHGIFTHRFIRELIASNLDQFGLLSVEKHFHMVIQGSVVVLLIVIVIIVGVSVFKKYHRE